MEKQLFKIELHKEIVWPIIIFSLLKYYGVGNERIVVLSVIWLVYLCVRDNRLHIIIPKIYGLYYYVFFIALAFFIGLSHSSMRDIVKDLYYITPTVIIMVIGYFYYIFKPEKEIRKTFYIAGLIITILSLISLLQNASELTELGDFRKIMGVQVHEVSLIAAMLFVEKIIAKKVVFSNRADWIILTLLSLKSFISFGRTELIISITMVVVTLLLNIFFSKDKGRELLRMIAIIMGVFAVSVFIYNSMPETAVDRFMEKLEYSMEEVDSGAGYTSTVDAMQHWRAYEAECAVAQWKKYNIFYEIVGKGFGTYTFIYYIPHDFNDRMVINHSIAILHNTYYTLLTKGGLIGVTSLIWLYFSNITILLRVKNKKYLFDLCIITVLTIGVAIMTYVVRGIFTQAPIYVWPFMVGSINAKIRMGAD